MYLTCHESVFCHHVVRRRRSFREGILVLSHLVLTLVFRELVLILIGLRTV